MVNNATGTDENVLSPLRPNPPSPPPRKMDHQTSEETLNKNAKIQIIQRAA